MNLPTKIYDWEKPVEFTEDFKWPSTSSITFTADSYDGWVKSVLPQVQDLQPGIDDYIHIGDDFKFRLRPLPTWHMDSPYIFCKPRPTRTKLSIYKGTTEKFVMFDDEINIPILFTHSGTWMSLTPNEVFTLRGQVRRAKGNVGVAGLGLGWLSRRILERKQVKKLVICDINKDILEFFGRPLKDEFGDKVELLNEDAYDVDWNAFDVSLWDIWQGFGDSGYDRKFKDIKDEVTKNGKFCIGWGQGIANLDRY